MYLTFKISNPQEMGLVISIFAIVVLTTFALHKLLMESRIKILEEQIRGVIEEKIAIENKAEDLYEKNIEIHELFEKSINLNTLKSEKLKKGEI